MLKHPPHNKNSSGSARSFYLAFLILRGFFILYIFFYFPISPGRQRSIASKILFVSSFLSTQLIQEPFITMKEKYRFLDSSVTTLPLKANIIFFILLLACSFSSSAQGLPLDSLRQWTRPENTPKLIKALEGKLDDTLRARMMRALCVRYSESNVDSALKYGQQVYLFCKEKRMKINEAWALDFMAAMHLKTGNTVKSIELSLQALRMYEKLKDLTFRSINYKNLGDAFVTQNDPRGISYYHQSIFIARPGNLGSFYKSWTMIALGNIYLEKNQLDSAMHYAQTANQLLQKLIDERFSNLKYYPECLNLLGRINQRSGNISLALEYFRLAVHHAIQYENLPSVGATYMDMAILFKTINKSDSSLQYARRAYEIASELQSPFLIVSTGSFLKEHFKDVNHIDSAFKYQEIMLAAKDTITNPEKMRQVQTIAFDEHLRQQELIVSEAAAKKERQTNLQFAGIAVALISFIILFLLLSRSILVKAKFIEFFGVLGLLAVFEFINLLIHPYLETITHHSPVLMLIILIAIGAMLVPLHHRLEKWLTKKMIEKNKAIRLSEARKTIKQLEGQELSPK